LAPYGLTLNARTEGGNARGALQLAHRRSDTLEKRRRLMADWAMFCGQHLEDG